MVRKLRRTLSVHIALLSICTIGSVPALAEPPSPTVSSVEAIGWARSSSPARYSVLPRPDAYGETRPSTARPIQTTRPMQSYSYGWFGVPATPSWSRSFGHRKAYTQWTLR